MTILHPGHCLHPNENLQSQNKLHTLIMQTDGNVVLYNRQHHPLWATNTYGITPREFIMQPDGNLVLYSTDGQARWASNTWNNPGAFLDVQNDGNLVVYKAGSGTETADNALWARFGPASNVHHGGGNGGIVGRMLELVNQQRGAAGVAPLSLNTQLMNSAQEHSQDMAAHNFMDHPGSDGSSPFDRMRRAGYSFSEAGENVAAGQANPEDAMSSWMNEQPPNDGHRRNILNPDFRDIGIGYAFRDGTEFKHYWTQDLGRR